MTNGSAKWILGALLAISLVSITGMVINGAFVSFDNAPEITIEGGAGKGKVKIEVPRVPGLKCPEGWKTTGGADPDTQSDFTSCTDGRYIVTTREGGGTAALDTQTGNFVDVKTIPAYQ